MSFPDASDPSGGWLDEEMLALLSRSEAHDHSAATGPLIKMETEGVDNLSPQRALKVEKRCEPDSNAQTLRVNNLRSVRVKRTRVKPVRPKLPRRRPKAEILRLRDELDALSTHLALLQQVRTQQLRLNAQVTPASSGSKPTKRQRRNECVETEHNSFREAKKVNQKLKRSIAEQCKLIQELESVLRDMTALQTPPWCCDRNVKDVRAAQYWCNKVLDTTAQDDTGSSYRDITVRGGSLAASWPNERWELRLQTQGVEETAREAPTSTFGNLNVQYAGNGGDFTAATLDDLQRATLKCTSLLLASGWAWQFERLCSREKEATK